MSSAEDREFVQSLAKGLAVIEAFGPDLPAMTLSEVARKTKLSPGSARRVLRTLQRLGYMQSDGQRFALAPRTLQLGYAYLASQPFTSLVQPRLAQLTQKVEGSCSVSVLDGTDVVYIARATNKRLSRDYMSVGTRFPAHATSPGKVLLAAMPKNEFERRWGGRKLELLTPGTITSIDRLKAALDEVRKKGWAVNNQETAVGHRSIAVPLRMNDRVVAALGIAGRRARHGEVDGRRLSAASAGRGRPAVGGAHGQRAHRRAGADALALILLRSRRPRARSYGSGSRASSSHRAPPSPVGPERPARRSRSRLGGSEIPPSTAHHRRRSPSIADWALLPRNAHR